ncbi:peptidylprolyl isomerase [SAR92 clade bacterium H246]
MKKSILVLIRNNSIFCACFLALLMVVNSGYCSEPAFAENAEHSVHVVIHTEYGDITIELDRAKAPIPADNFLRYVDNGFYRDSFFYRAIKNLDLIIAGINGKSFYENMAEIKPAQLLRPVLLPLPGPGEVTLARGDIAYVHLGDGKTVQSEFLLMTGDSNKITYRWHTENKIKGVKPFGQVVLGMDVVDKIYAGEIMNNPNPDWNIDYILNDPVKIISVKRQ